MALFFKHIRQKLLISKRFGKYSLYALGEVMIVIAGILVAVEVNNRNERQQEKEVQIELLKGIKAELETDFDNLKYDKNIHLGQVGSSLIILDHLENNLPYHDSLAKYFLSTCEYTITLFNRGGYETLKSLGVGIIANIDLRKDIIYLYDGRYAFLDEVSNGLESDAIYREKHILNTRFEEAQNYDLVLGENFEGVDAIGGMIPLDFNALRHDSEYLYYLKTTKNKHKLYLTILEATIEDISEVILKIEEEIKRLEQK